MYKDKLSRYRNLADLSQDEWQNLNIHYFIAANFNRYCGALIKKIGAQYLPSDASDTLLGLFCDVGFKPLAAIHRRNLSASGERRNQLMLGTLKMIAATRMVEAVIKEFPAYITLDMLPETIDNSYQDDYTERRATPPKAYDTSRQQALFAASHDGHDETDATIEADVRYEELSMMVENIRSHLTPTQYDHLRYSLCEGLSSRQIAEKTGHSTTNVRIMLLNARKKMLELVPSHLAAECANYLHRR